MAKVAIKKELPLEVSDINGEKTFIPIYHLYVNDKVVGRYYNIYEAAREAERKMDWDVLEVSYKENPQSFSSIVLPLEEVKEQ